MTSNFAFLKQNPEFQEFTPACIEAEMSYSPHTTTTTAIAVRRALEVTVKWLYKVEEELTIPYRDNLTALIHEYCFKQLVDQKLFPRIRFIITLGNKAAHTNKKVTDGETKTALRSLFDFISWVDFSYSEVTNDRPFNEALLTKEPAVDRTKLKELEALAAKLEAEKEALLEERQGLASQLEEERKSKAEREQFTAQRKEKESKQEFHCDEISEFETRKIYINLALEMANWSIGSDCREEVEVTPMPTPSNKGFVDYVLYDDNGSPLAVIEAKRSSVDPKSGKQQAKLYADALEEQHGVRPLIFYSNGFETYFWDSAAGAPRTVSGFFTKEELQWLFYQKEHRLPLTDIRINPDIAGRPYQTEAITRTCESYGRGERKALLVMATGSGKTRTAVSLVDVLIRKGWVKKILFLADRRELVKQAKQTFKALLPNLTMCNLLDKGNDQASDRMIFSTYPTMINAIDAAKSKDGSKLFTPAHFDLIIIDEAHRSIYKKYQDIFTYFDGMLFGLTATPHNEVDRNTYSLFELENENPTFAYELGEAVKQGYLVPYNTRKTKLKFIEEGIKYDELSDKEKEEWDEKVGEGIDDMPSDALNKFLFNKNTVDIVLQNLMDKEKGQRIEGGDKIGKTIIFAQNQKHANFILDRFNAQSSTISSNSFAEVITTNVKYAETLIEDFKDSTRYPQIAISVDMLDTGIDVPEILNLVFFKKVRSKAKFWQMVGRGTRLCENVFGYGQHKEKFVIFDYCGNFEYFRINKNGVEGKITTTLTEKLFIVRARIARELQHLQYQTPDLEAHRSKLVATLVSEIGDINRGHFPNNMRIQFIDRYNRLTAWENISDLMIEEIIENIVPLIPAIEDNELAKRFDFLMYTIELADLEGIPASLPKGKVIGTAQALSTKGNVPAVKAQAKLIEAVLTDIHWENADIFTHEEVRLALRNLLTLLDKETQPLLYTNFEDTILSVHEDKGHYSVNDLKNYRQRVESYLNEHRDEIVIFKLRNNRKMTKEDIQRLEEVLWQELGTEEEYHKEFGDEPLVKLVAKLVGLERAAANEYFSEFLTNNSLNANQIDFVETIINHIVANGRLFDNSILQKHPFTKHGSVVELFDGKVEIIHGMMGKVRELNDRLVI